MGMGVATEQQGGTARGMSARVGAAIAALGRGIFGSVSWQSPRWLSALVALLRRHPRRVLRVSGALLVLGLGSYGLHQWWVNRPHPLEPPKVELTVQAPAVTDYSKTPIVVHPLLLRFSASVAPIALVGKSPVAGIALSPGLPGTWLWRDDHTLSFMPQSDWPVGQHYRIELDRDKLLTAGVRLTEPRLGFDSAPFTASVTSNEFYQDPQDPLQKSAIIGVSFNYPVDPSSFERSVELAMLDAKGKPSQKYGFSVTYDARHLNAFVHSAPLGVPEDTRILLAKFAADIKSARGGPGTAQSFDARVQIPGLYSLAVDSAALTLVENDHYEPEQVLIVQTSAAVRGSELAPKVRAWLLPTHKPAPVAGAAAFGPLSTGEPVAQPDHKPPHAWYLAEVSQQLLSESTPLTLSPKPGEREYESMHGLALQAPPGRYVYVQVQRGLDAFGGYVLGKPYAAVLQVPQYPQLLRFMGQGSLLSMSGDQRLSVVARNVPGMRVSVARVLPDQLQHLAAFNQGSFEHPMLGAFGPDHITTRTIEHQPLAATDPIKATYAGVDLGRYLNAGGQPQRGVFLVRLQPWNPAGPKDQNGDYSDQSSPFDSNSGGYGAAQVGDSRLIVITDLGLIVKRNLDGSQDVFVQSIKTGQPVAGATVKVIAENGGTLLSSDTGTDGHVHFATLKGFTRENTPVMYTVSKGEDYSFLPTGANDRRLDFSRFDVGGAPNAVSAGQLSAYLFSDRGLYRPGDTLHIGMIVRAANWAQNIAGVPLELELLDARGMSVAKRMVTPDASGFVDWQYTTAETAPTGNWTANLYLVKDQHRDSLIGSTTVIVREFEPDRMRVSAHLEPTAAEGWVKPGNLHALVAAQNLYGTPAAGHRVQATLTLRPAFPSFAAYPEFHFYDPQRAREGYSETLQAQTTDAKGEASFDLDLSKYASATYQLRFYAQVFEADSGRNVAAAASTLVSNADYLIGVKADGALDYIPRDTPRKLHLLAINPEAKPTAVPGLRAVILERHYVSVLTRQDSGVYKYESRLRETQISSAPLAIAAAGDTFDLPTATPGSYAFAVENAKGQVLNRIDYAVAGSGNVTRSLERNAELQLALNKTDYKPGETIDVAIRAPYSGSGLITIERDKVYAWTWFHSDTTSSVQHITLPRDFEGNGYINVQFVRDPSSNAIYMSPLSYGVAPFSVDMGARREPLILDAPTLIKPGQTLHMTVHTPGSAQIVVFAVDEGILQVAGYKLGDPLDFFFRKRMLQVSTAQILDLILPAFDKLMGMSTPGGDENALRSQQLNPFRRKHEKPVAYWSGITTVNGSHTFDYIVPDSFNGALRVMAIAVTPQRIGIAQRQTVVRGDFVLSPNAPLAVAPGDTFTVSLGVANNLTGVGTAPLPISVSLAPTPALAALSPLAQTLRLAPGHAGTLQFQLRANAVLGSADLRFTARYGDKQAQRGTTLSVHPPLPLQSDVSFGRLDAGQTLSVQPLRAMYPEHAQRTLLLAHTPVVLAGGLSAFLVDYPNRCTEQIVSAATPALILHAQPQLAATLGGAIDADASLKQAIDALRERQNAEGGFGVWAATPVSDPYVSAYAMQFLLYARGSGVPVPSNMLESGFSYLRSLAADDSHDSLAGLRARAFATMLLTQSGMVTSNLIAGIQQRLQRRYPDVWKDDLAAAYLAASYQLLKQDAEAQRLLQGPFKVLDTPPPPSLPWSYSDYYDPLIRDASMLLVLETVFPQQAAQLPRQALDNILEPLRRGHYNSLSAALTLLALEGYQHGAPPAPGDLRAHAEIAPGRLQAFGAVAGALLSGSYPPTATALKLNNAGNTPAWYALTQSGFDRVAPTHTIKDGLEIVREYTDTQGHALTSVHLGQEIEERISIRALGDRAVGDVAIVDILPGGFEVVQRSPAQAAADAASVDESSSAAGNGSEQASVLPDLLAQPGSTLQTDYVEPREDRVLIYATAARSVQQFVYRLRPTNVGDYVIPPIYAASMYDRTLRAYTPGSGTLRVLPPQPAKP